MKNIFIVSGPKHSGKTSNLLQWIKNRENVFGILSPIVHGKRHFFDIAKNELFLMEGIPEEEQTISVGKYIFSAAAFERANNILRQGLENSSTWLILDEIGPLELQGKGFSSILHEILANKSENLSVILVIREDLLESVCDYFMIGNEWQRLIL